MKIKGIIMASVLALSLCACAPDVNVPAEETTTATSVQETTAETTDALAKVVSPLPSDVDVNATDCTLRVSFEEGGIYMDDSGKYFLDAKIYDYEKFDMVDISQLAVGDIIVLRGEEVQVESIKNENGRLAINGYIDEGGYELKTDDSGVWYESLYSDLRQYYEVGEVTLPIADGFMLVDEAIPDERTEYSVEIVAAPDETFLFHFVPNNTEIVVEGGVVTGMHRYYNP